MHVSDIVKSYICQIVCAISMQISSGYLVNIDLDILWILVKSHIADIWI